MHAFANSRDAEIIATSKLLSMVIILRIGEILFET